MEISNKLDSIKSFLQWYNYEYKPNNVKSIDTIYDILINNNISDVYDDGEYYNYCGILLMCLV